MALPDFAEELGSCIQVVAIGEIVFRIPSPGPREHAVGADLDQACTAEAT